MTKIGKKLAAVFLAVAMVVTFIPVLGIQTVYAASPDGMVLGTDVLSESVNTDSAQTVYMAGKEWRVIGYNGSGVASSIDTMTLISSGNLKTGVQFREDYLASDANNYSKSNLKTEVDAIAATFSDGEKGGIAARDLASGKYNGSDTDCISGDEVKGALLWPLSTKEANALDTDLRRLDEGTDRDWETDYWRLRSPGVTTHDAALVGGDGTVYGNGSPVYFEFGVRPAFNYNLKSVLFTSAAEDGKSSGTEGADALIAQSDLTNSGSEWKVTVKDNAHVGFTISKTTLTENGVSVEYTGAATGTNEYISAIITDKPVPEADATIKYYGRIAAASNATGTVTINTAGKIEENDYLYVFNEQCNGDKKTDYASAFKNIPFKFIAIPTGKTLTYNGKSQTGVVAGTGYTLSGTASATNAGSYQATATLDEGYGWSDGSTVTKTIKWTITKKAITPAVTLSAKAYTYNGKVQKPTVTVKDGSTKLAASQYTLTYASGRKNVGSYKVTVKMKGNYSGSKAVSFKINPKGTTLSKVTKAKKAATVKWKKQAAKMSASRITGYQIQLATNSKFTKNKKTVNVKGYSKISEKVTGLKGGKKYWVRIRTYKKVGSTTYYSPWSKVKTVTTGK